MKRLILAVAMATIVLAACGSGGPSGSAASVAPPARSATPTSVAQPSTEAGNGQTDTEWGPIWDTLPRRFPQIPGARPFEEGATGPASATMIIGGDVARLVATALVNQLAGAGFPTAGLGTPLEGGTYVLDATGPTPGCKLQVTIQPMGGDTILTILYGAACPQD